jgi:cell division protein FtsL
LFYAILNLFLAVALLILAFLARLFALGVQDRVIRLEERLRYQQLLPQDLKARINEFTTKQLVALRFASDAELPAVARKVLAEKMEERKAIKQMIQNWRADYQRI